MTEKTSNSASKRKRGLEELNRFAAQSCILKEWDPVALVEEGTFSRIFKVVNRQTGQEAVLKFVPNPIEEDDCGQPGSPEDAFYRSRFEASKREAEIMNRFRGEDNIVQYLAEPEYLRRTFEGAHGEKLMQYAVMICMPMYINHKEWMPAIAQDRRRRIQMGIDIAHALMVFEKKGVYHRDIKPGNIMMDGNGTFYLADVGEAKLESEFTTLGFHGTRPYMAPEVYRQENERRKMRSDHRSDIYSLGIVLYRLFNHQQFPFLTDEGSLTVDASRSYSQYEKKNGMEGSLLPDGERARLLRYDGQKLPRPAEADDRLAEVILRACAYKQDDRYQTAEELYHALRACLEQGNSSLRKQRRTDSKTRGCMKQLLWLSVALLALLVGVIFFAVRAPQPTPAAPTTQPPLTATAAPTATAVPTATATAAPMDAPTAAPVVTATATPTAVPTATPTPTPVPTATPIPIPAGLEYTIESNSSCTITNYTGDAAELVIPEMIEGKTVTNIAYDAFGGCTSLRSIVLPDTITGIGDTAFSGCASLKTIELSDALEYIGDGAFSGCTSLQAVKVPDKIEYIGDRAFSDCTSLQSLELPNSLTRIEWAAFSSCASLQSIELPDSIISIGGEAFCCCSALQSIKLPDKIEHIGDGAFSECTSLQSLELPNSLTRIEWEAFSSCTSLQTIKFPNSLTTIEYGVFSNCTSLQSIELPDSLAIIGQYAFSDCTSLQSIELPDGVTKIDDWAFAYNYSLESITIPESVIDIGDYAFEQCSDNLTFTVPKNSYAETYIEQKGLYHLLISATTASDPSVPAGLKYKPYGATGCMITDYTGSANELVVPERIDGRTVTHIGSFAFIGCDSLQFVEFPDSVTSIGDSAFEDCNILQTIDLPNGITSIGKDTFAGCNSLQAINLPDSVTGIGGFAFYGCSSLQTIELPASMTSIGPYVFEDCSDDLTLIVPANSYAEEYAKQSGLKYQVVPSGISLPNPDEL